MSLPGHTNSSRYGLTSCQHLPLNVAKPKRKSSKNFNSGILESMTEKFKRKRGKKLTRLEELREKNPRIKMMVPTHPHLSNPLNLLRFNIHRLITMITITIGITPKCLIHTLAVCTLIIRAIREIDTTHPVMVTDTEEVVAEAVSDGYRQLRVTELYVELIV